MVMFRILYEKGDCIMAPTEVLMRDRCPLGLLEILKAAHVNVPTDALTSEGSSSFQIKKH